METLVPVKDRWTPIYLEHGRLEVDDSSVKWISADGNVCRIPVATVSSLILGPGTTVTHAAIKACAECNTVVCWAGEDSLRFYAFGIAPNHGNENARTHAEAWANKRRRTGIARRMFCFRFPNENVDNKTIKELRGMEGIRVRKLYYELGVKYGVTWKGRNYNTSNWHIADEINKVISTANAALYAICSSAICSLGYLPSLGFVHQAGTLAFVYDVADLYKHLISLPAAFEAVRQKNEPSSEFVRKKLKLLAESENLLKRLPKDLSAFFELTSENTQDGDLLSSYTK